MPTEADPALAPLLPAVSLADALMLVSFWKPVVLMLPLIAWGWFVSTVMDKHAARFHLPRKQWNLVHLAVALVALALAFLMPVAGHVGFLAGLGAIVVLLLTDVLVFAGMHNRDERVPEGHELKLDFSEMAARREAKKAAKEAGTVELKIVGPDKTATPVPDRETPEFEIRATAEAAMVKSIDARARLYEIAPLGGDQGYGVSAIIDGVRQGIEKMAPQSAVKVIDFWKGCAGLDVADRRRKQVAEISVSKGDIWSKQVRLVTIGGQAGPKLTLTFDPNKAVIRDYDDLGLFEPQSKALEEIRQIQGGLVLVAAPPGNGLTTTMYALVGKHDPYTSIVQTVELDVQAPIEGVHQNAFDSSGEGEYSTLVRSILRRDPNVVGVTDLNDAETARQVVAADLKRTKVYQAVRADGAMNALQGFAQAHGDPGAVADVLVGVVAQKLARRLCVNCRVAYQPDPNLLKKLSLPPDRVKQLFKKGGQVLIKNKPEVCPMCAGSGYMGQVALMEVFPIGEGEKQAIRDKNWTALRAELRKRQLFTIQQAGLRRAVEGVTSLEEFSRVTAAPQQKKPQQRPPKAAS